MKLVHRMSGIVDSRLLIAAVFVALVACTPTGVAVESEEATATQRPTPTATPSSTPGATPTPTVRQAAVDPEFAFELWKETLVGNQEFYDQIATAVESDYFWIDTVDRVGYDPETHRLTLDATVSFERVYLNDPQEWRNDTWTLYRDLARFIWEPFIEGAEEGAGQYLASLDWPRFLPTVVLNANTGRLQASCPGSLTYAVIQRQATQAEFEQQCSFIP